MKCPQEATSPGTRCLRGIHAVAMPANACSCSTRCGCQGRLVMMQHSAFSLTLAQSCRTHLTVLPFTRL
uniref:Uncharacterized protein n=1 Tax=Arundo donax TaxID=35708 RepID=A0A0A9DVA0_ARUDO